MSVDITKYLNMSDTNPNAEVYDESSKNKEEIAWEDEFFHAAYISGKTRIEEKLNNKKIIGGFIQIRGIEYNLEEFYMVPYYKRQVLVKNEKIGKYDSAVCFSFFDYDDEGRLLSTSGFFCPPNSSERREVDWCSNCKTNIILIGFLSDENGNLKKDDDGKPYNVFIKASGSKVGDVMKYFFECQELEVPYLFTENPTDQSLLQEKNYFNIFRRVIKVSVDIVDTYNPNNNPDISKTRNAYKLEGVKELPPANIFKLLDYAASIEDKIKEKFDYSDLANKNAKKIKYKLDAFRNSSVFKNNNPNYKPSDSSPNIVTFDDGPTQTQVNHTQSNNTSNNEKKSNGDSTTNWDDIPF